MHECSAITISGWSESLIQEGEVTERGEGGRGEGAWIAADTAKQERQGAVCSVWGHGALPATEVEILTIRYLTHTCQILHRPRQNFKYSVVTEFCD